MSGVNVSVINNTQYEISIDTSGIVIAHRKANGPALNIIIRMIREGWDG